MSGARDGIDRRRLRHIPALNGLRGLAVLAVVLYHANVPYVVGGQLGVTMFFTLSGFLITSLLLVERDRTGRISLAAFWARRARRLVPAMLVCLVLCAAVLQSSGQPVGRGVVGDAIASMLWVANWRFVLAHHSYGDLFSMPSPFQHFWSLAVEEQYYLVFPLVAAAVLARAGRRALSALIGQLIVLSSALSLLLVIHAPTILRAYYGTDTRIAEILVGALLATVLVRGSALRAVGPAPRVALDAAALLALGLLAALITALPYGDLRLFRGGLLLTATCTAVVIAAAVQPGSLVGRLLSLPPLTALGAISYGVYLFHWPLFLLITAHRSGLDGVGLFLARITATFALATLSYAVIEMPVRRNRIRRGPALASWAVGAVAGVAAVALAAGVLTMPRLEQPALAASPGQAQLLPGPLPVPSAAVPRAPGPVSRTGPNLSARARVTVAAVTPSASTRSSHAPARVAPMVASKEFYGEGVDYAVAPPLPSVPAGALKVLVVGDSIGNNLGRGLVSWASGRSDVAVYNLAIPACPVSRGGDRRLDPDNAFPIESWCPWWSDTSSARYSAMLKFAPNVVLVEDGINATFERRLPSWSDWEKPGVAQFDDWMVSEYQAFIDTFRNLGAKVVVANAPCGDWQRLFPGITDGPQRVRDLNRIDYPRTLGNSSANFFAEICPNGQYSDTVDGVADARPDGFHLIDAAATALARDWLGPLLLQVGAGSVGGVAAP